MRDLSDVVHYFSADLDEMSREYYFLAQLDIDIEELILDLCDETLDSVLCERGTGCET